MTVLDQLWPRADHLTDEHSRALLGSVVASRRTTRRRPRWDRVAALCLGGAIVAGGTAYAAGLVPEIVSERFQQLRGGPDGWPDPIYGEHQVADVLLSNGKYARVWYAETTDGRCVIRDLTDAVTRPAEFGVGCARWSDAAEQTDPRRGVHWQTSAGGPAVVYGDFGGVTADVASVQVAGPDWTRSFPVEGHAFAGEVPAGAEGEPVRFTYLDPTGRPIASDVTDVVIESE